jgi:hypothetical protein
MFGVFSPFSQLTTKVMKKWDGNSSMPLFFLEKLNLLRAATIVSFSAAVPEDFSISIFFWAAVFIKK